MSGVGASAGAEEGKAEVETFVVVVSPVIVVVVGSAEETSEVKFV